MPDWFTNGYPDPDLYREQLRRRVVRLRRLWRIQTQSPYRKNGKPSRYFGLYSFDVDNAVAELARMTAK